MALFASTAGWNTAAALTAIVCYVSLCRGLRFLRRNQQHAQMPYKTPADFQNMTAEDAWHIVRYAQSLEFPWMTGKALSFALFRTYGIPSISKLLCETQQLGHVDYAGRRFADTVVLIVEFLANSPTSERANAAISRMNYLHGRYQKAGKISNDDLLYTLSLFILEVERWVRVYDWRELTPMEKCGLGTHWKAVGDAMGISYSALRRGPNNFKHGLEFFEDVEEWSDDYERRCMTPSRYNHQLAEETTRILLINVPGPFKASAKPFVTALMDDRLRCAMMYEKPSPMYLQAIKVIFGIRKVVSKYLLLPQPEALRYTIVSEEADAKTGRYHVSEYDSEPWYVKPTFLARNSPLAWFRRVIGVASPDGEHYKPQGYKIFELGPEKMEKLGEEECIAMRDRLMEGNRSTCPFAV